MKVRWELEAGAGSRGDRQRWGAGCALLAGGGSRNPGPPEGQRKVCHGHLAAPLGPHLACLGPESRAPAEEPCAKLWAVGTPALQPHEPPAQLRPRLLPTTRAWALLPRPTAGRPPGQTPSALRPADCPRGPHPRTQPPELGALMCCLLCIPGPTVQSGHFQASGSVSLSLFTACPPPRVCPARSSLPTSESPSRTPSLFSVVTGSLHALNHSQLHPLSSITWLDHFLSPPDRTVASQWPLPSPCPQPPSRTQFRPSCRSQVGPSPPGLLDVLRRESRSLRRPCAALGNWTSSL